MYHQDTVGKLLQREIVAAADRDVRVRLLIDDMYGGEADDVWFALDAHPRIEVRLFNPFVRGRSKNLQFITRLKTVNHRMHNKTFTVDNQATIVGGRNIGDEYFDADPELAFADLDVLAVGPVVRDVSAEFDQYWNSAYAYPAAILMPAAGGEELDALRQELDDFSSGEKAAVYIEALEGSPLARSLRQKNVRFSFAQAKVIHDSPDKLVKDSDDWEKDLLISQLAPYIQEATREFTLVSPYFVPGQRGAEALCQLSDRGVRVRVLTNSLVSNDVAAVHVGYMRHRKHLLRCGVELYELNEQLKEIGARRFTWLPGLSKSSLHAKSMMIDRQAMFVGSFNFDLRSLNINNEIGILFREPDIAAAVAENFDNHIDQVAFRVELVKGEDGDEALRWTGRENGATVVFDSEPYAGFWQKVVVSLMRFLPIDSML
jgi:putative cardiolipin synthase